MKRKKITWNYVPPMVHWNRLRAFRKVRGIRQIDIASNCDISLPVLYFLENGLEGRVSGAIKKRIANYLQVEVGELFPGMMCGDNVVASGARVSMKPYESRGVVE